jgi:hypothetical protein
MIVATDAYISQSILQNQKAVHRIIIGGLWR